MSDASLTVGDLKIVLRSIWKDRTKWRNIGIELNFLDSDLDAIQGNCGDIDHCFTKLISKWLRQVNPKSTWEALVEALNSPLVDSKDTARTIETKYLQRELPLKAGEIERDLPEIELPLALHPLQEEMKKLDNRFSNLVGETEEYLENNGTFSVPHFRKLFGRFPSTRRHQHEEFLDQYIFNADPKMEPLDLWLKFCRYWHFINYELLQFIIENCGAPEDLAKGMEQYDADMKVFCNETSMHDFVKYCFPELYLKGLCAKCEHQHSVPLQVKVSNKLNRFSKLTDLNYLGEDVVKTFSLPRICGLILKYVSPGCFSITWSVPSYYCKKLRWKLSICDEQFFKKYDIMSISLNGGECFSVGRKRTPINPADEIASNTDVTEEAFDLQDMMEKVITSPFPITITQLCTAYICKLLTQHLSTHLVYGGKGIQVRALSDLPPDVHTQFMFLCELAHEHFVSGAGSGFFPFEQTLSSKDLPEKIESTSLKFSLKHTLSGKDLSERIKSTSLKKQFLPFERTWSDKIESKPNLKDDPLDIVTQGRHLPSFKHGPVYKDLPMKIKSSSLESGLEQEVEISIDSGQLHSLESTSVGKDLPEKIESTSLKSSLKQIVPFEHTRSGKDFSEKIKSTSFKKKVESKPNLKDDPVERVTQGRHLPSSKYAPVYKDLTMQIKSSSLESGLEQYSLESISIGQELPMMMKSTSLESSLKQIFPFEHTYSKEYPALKKQHILPGKYLPSKLDDPAVEIDTQGGNLHLSKHALDLPTESEEVEIIMDSGQLPSLECTSVGKDLPMKIDSMSTVRASAVIASMKCELPENVDGLGLTKIEESSHVFIHRTVTEYLAALFLTRMVKVNDEELLQHIGAVGETSFLPYFVAGLKEWGQLARYQFRNINLFEFEASSIVDIYANYYYCCYLVKTVKDIVSHTTSSSELKWISRCQPFSKGKYGLEIRDRIKVVDAFCSFVYGRLCYLSDQNFCHSRFERSFQYFAMGLISASELLYSKKLTHSLGDLRIEVECTTPELDFLINLPYSILKRISDLELFTHSGEAHRVLSNVEDTDWLFTELLQKSTRLERLTLSVQDFNSIILRKLQSNTSLKCLSLKSSLTTEHLTDLCNVLKSSSLSKLTLTHSGIGDNGIEELAIVLKFNKLLESLTLHDENIGVKGMAALADALLVNTTLTYLSLDFNKISSAGTKVIGEALKSNTTLIRLSMWNNCIGVDGAQALAEGLASNKSLTKLDLSDNKILDDGAKALAKALKVNTRLNSLDVSDNNIGDDGARALADMLMVNTSLKTLQIRGKAMTSRSAKFFQNALLHNKIITRIIISKKIVQSKMEYDKRLETW